MVIWRFPFHIEDRPVLSMPEGARVLCVQVVRGVPSIYALVNADAPKALRAFRVFGTGHSHPQAAYPEKYVGTLQLVQGELTFHVFEEERA